MHNTPLPPRILDWLHARGIDDSTISSSGIYWDGSRVVLPVFDRNGAFLFNKYRRDPDSDEGPKYMYDKGSEVSLYGIEQLNRVSRPVPRLFLCEGEFDALVLRSQGYLALTSTGGSSSFQKTWRTVFENVPTTIIFDNDDAGIKGAFTAHAIIGPSSSIVWLPKEVGPSGDITDFFAKLGNTKTEFEKLLAQARTYNIQPNFEEPPKTKKELQAYISRDNATADAALEEQRQLKREGKSFRHTEMIIDLLTQRSARNRRLLKYRYGRRPQIEDDDGGQAFAKRLSAAKEVPIESFMPFDSGGNAPCIWHSEKTPSLHLYRTQNKVFCFGCRAGGDAIDVVMQLKNISLAEAIDFILGPSN